MRIFGNMQVLTLLSRVLTSLTYQDGYCGCGGSQRYCYGMFAVHKLSFVAPKFWLRRVQKKGKKGQKIKILHFEKNTFLFLRVHELEIILGVNTDWKNRVGKVCSPENFFDFSSPVKQCIFGNFLFIFVSIKKYPAIFYLKPFDSNECGPS